MTLRAKFLYINEIANYNHFNILTNKLEKIADNFAVGFAEWSVARALGCDTFTINQDELNIYKKEKGL